MSKGSGPLGWLTARPRSWWQQWWESRLPRRDQVTFHQRNLYILPTRAGWAFALALGVMLLASINEQLNLGYALTFSLAGAALTSMYQAHANLKGLTVRLHPVQSVHAGNAGNLTISVMALSGRNGSFGLRLSLPDTDQGSHHIDLDVRSDGEVQTELDWPAPIRGRHPLPRITIESRYPLGFFRVWGYWRPESSILVWPALDPSVSTLPDNPDDPNSNATAMSARPRQGGMPTGLRDYRRGDSPRLIAWRKSSHAMAAGSGLVSREAVSSTSQDLWLDYGASEGMSSLTSEQRLSRLASWLLLAEQSAQEESRHYGLRLPGEQIDCARGALHLRACLDALASYGGARS